MHTLYIVITIGEHSEKWTRYGVLYGKQRDTCIEAL